MQGLEGEFRRVCQTPGVAITHFSLRARARCVQWLQSSFVWCCVPSPPLRWGCVPPSSVGWCFAVFLPSPFSVVLPSSSFGWLFSPLLLGGAAWFFLPFGWCCLPSLGGAAFLPSSVGWCRLVSSFFWVVLLFCVVLRSFPSLWVGLRSPSLMLGGAAWFPSPPLSGGGVAFSLSFCVVLPPFASFGWGCVPSLFCWVVLLIVFSSPWGWCCCFSFSFWW